MTAPRQHDFFQRLFQSCLHRFARRPKTERVMGMRIREPRLTWLAAAWVVLYLALPVVLLGTLVDLLIQAVTGYCSGFWCHL